jgi:predicted dehydrogenase
MDYTRAPLTVRLRKVARYARLYGPSRTAVKVRSQYHMKKTYRSLPQLGGGSGAGHVGVIGCGKFAYAQIAYFLTRAKGPVLRGAMDTDLNRAASLAQRYDLAYYTDDADRLLADDAIDLVYIASNHASHADYAVRALEAGKAVHIEKPHVVSADQLERLCSAMVRHRGRVRLGFNRPESRMGGAVADALAGQTGSAAMSWFVVGHEIPADHWYFGEEEGGRVLGNMCHWTDFVLQMVPPAGRFPILITPTPAPDDADILVSYVFGDGSVAAITFSSKGHTFEGVRERFTANKGTAMVFLDDFGRLVIEDEQRRRRSRPLFRDHGHRDAILRSYAMSGADPGPGSPVEYVWNTAMLFLATKRALEERRGLTVDAYAGEPRTEAGTPVTGV